MKADWDKIAVEGLTDLSPAVRRSLVQPIVLALERARAILNGVRIDDNLAAARVTVGSSDSLVVSNVERTFAFSRFKPVLFTPSHAVAADGTAVMITGWKPDLRRADGLIGITVTLSASAIVHGIVWAG